MPEGSDKQKLDNVSQQKIGGSLATDKAKSARKLRPFPTEDEQAEEFERLTGGRDEQDSEDFYRDYPEERALMEENEKFWSEKNKKANEQKNLMGKPAETDDFSAGKEAGTNKNFEPGGGNPEEDTGAPKTEPDFSPAEAEGFEKNAQQEQLNAQQQAEVAASLAGSKQRQLLQIQKEKAGLEKQLSELEKALTDLKNSKLGGFLSVFQPRINLLTDTLIEQLKKKTSNLSDEAKVTYYTTLIAIVSSLIAILTALKFFTAFLDAAFIDTFSCLRLIIASFATCIIPIILVLISPIYIPFLALLFLIGKIPLVKGILTKNIIELIEKLKKQRTVWKDMLVKLKKKVALRKQIKDLNKFEQQVKRWH